MKDVFDADYKQKYIETGLIPTTPLSYDLLTLSTPAII